MNTSDVTLPGSPDATPARVTRAWRINGPDPIPARRWLAMAGAVASWAGSPIIVERRWVTPAPDALVADLLVIAIDGAGVTAASEELARDAGLMGRGLLAGLDHTPLDDGATGWLPTPLADVAELRRIPRRARSHAARESLAATLSALAVECGQACVSVSMASPALCTEAPVDGDPDVADTLRCRVRLIADRTVPVVALSHLGALVGCSARDWVRPRGSGELHAARHAVSGPATHLWGEDHCGEHTDPSTPVASVVDLISLSVAQEALRRGEL